MDIKVMDGIQDLYPFSIVFLNCTFLFHVGLR